jgi:ferredoxin-like protein FixX
VVNEGGVLQDIYARADITKLCKGNAYNRLQWEDVTVRGGSCVHCTVCAQ